MKAYFDSVLVLASHFIARLWHYASYCRTLATHTVNSDTCSMTLKPFHFSSFSSKTQLTNETLGIIVDLFWKHGFGASLLIVIENDQLSYPELLPCFNSLSSPALWEAPR
ncbi:hypothetical protein Lalb_Chr05g0218401 [Lupinus albus]|uniref:Uncharacterized protein n=1 Tax=Lupinus albus TaxID=3870 RepID=A0A6A4QHY5_LUPAL|nr:hypothetical protein Lalb_Chr05g0218401 [Lupinus albus]